MDIFERINLSFNPHDVDEDQQERMEAVRKKMVELAICIAQLVPDSREKSLAMTNLEQTQMWAIKSIAINPTTKGEINR